MAVNADEEWVRRLQENAHNGVIKRRFYPVGFADLPEDERWRLLRLAGLIDYVAYQQGNTLAETLQSIQTGDYDKSTGVRRRLSKMLGPMSARRGGYGPTRRKNYEMRMAAFMAFIRENPTLTAREIAERNGLNRRTVQLWQKRYGLTDVTDPEERRRLAVALLKTTLT